MLQNFAKKQVKKVKDDVDYIENSIRHIREKLELRRNLNEKKAIAAKQFFDLTRREMDRIEREFWESHN
jgi:predicted  nucleic acid-binding Zn-ribbon protein